MDGTDSTDTGTTLTLVAAPQGTPGSPGAFDPSAYKDGLLDEVKLDDFEVKMPSGRLVRPHVGESVWLMSYGFSLADEMRVAEFQSMDKDTPPEQMDRMFDAIADMLTRIVVGWNITGPTRIPYPQPSEGPHAIKMIPTRLFKYLFDQIRAEEPEGNADGGSAA